MSQEDFTVIDETVLMECGKVRMVPHQRAGRLSLLRVKDSQFFITWTPASCEDERATKKIPVTEGITLIPDEDSGTLLIMTPTSGTWLFHFLAGSPEAFASLADSCGRSEEEGAQIREQKQVYYSSDIGFDILSQFAKVKRFYASTASRILGLEQQPRRRLRSTQTAIPRNPWLKDHPALVYPKSNRLATPLTSLIWRSFHEDDGRVIEGGLVALKDLVHRASTAEETRQDVWRLLFGLRTESMSDEDYEKHLEELQGEFQRIIEISQFTDIQERIEKADLQHRIDKDVFRTDRTLPFYHPNPTTIEADLKLDSLRTLQQLLLAYYAYDPDLDYVQGMADLLSPILFVLRDETEAFWAFVNLMKRQRANFLLDSPSIDKLMRSIQELVRLMDPHLSDYLSFHNDSAQLFFCYRWLLLLFKREFSFNDTLCIWETILTAPSGTPAPYEVYIAAAILDLAKADIIQESMGFGETLAHLSEMTHSIPVITVLERADQIHQVFSQDAKLKWLLTNALASE